ncbi:MAG: helix-turn-helix transcriptional regulator [Actinobacteria bacterium]|nr:helix-turn-helix transcriptional regulator [Actinomycetota bacterium]
MLELAILGLLKEQDLHGYELKKRLTETLGSFSSVSFGSLYPALNRLERAGGVAATEAGDEPAVAVPVPMTGSLDGELAAYRATRRPTRRAGRSRKVYRITPRGDALFAELLAADNAAGDDERLFHLRLAFARFLPPDERVGLLERRRAQLVERLARSRANRKSARDRDAYAQSLAERDTELTERDISWLDRLLAAERTPKGKAKSR